MATIPRPSAAVLIVIAAVSAASCTYLTPSIKADSACRALITLTDAALTDCITISFLIASSSRSVEPPHNSVTATKALIDVLTVSMPDVRASVLNESDDNCLISACVSSN